jgi:hypothetical protein
MAPAAPGAAGRPAAGVAVAAPARVVIPSRCCCLAAVCAPGWCVAAALVVVGTASGVRWQRAVAVCIVHLGTTV